MIKPNSWTGLETWLDQIVDSRFAEAVLLVPWVIGSGVYVEGEQGPDPSRKMIDTKAVFVTPGAQLIGESGRATGGGFDTQVLENECWISIVVDNIGSYSNWRKSDRVYLKDRNEWYEISYFAPDATRRPNIHLVRLNDMMSSVDSPVGLVTPPNTNQLYFNSTSKRFYRATGTGPGDWELI